MRNHGSPFELSREEMRALGYRVVDILTEHLATLPQQRVGAKAVPERIYDQLSEPPPEQGVPIDRLLDQLCRDILPKTMHVNHPRFFAFVPGPGNYVGVMADALAAGYNVFTGTWLGGSAAEAVETVTVDWLRQLCGFDENCRGLFVSGGTMANLTALAVARHTMLDDALENAVIYMSDQAHSSLDKALRVLGFAPKQIVRLPCDDDFRLRSSEAALRIAQDRERGLRAFCIIASAGTTNTGAVDPLPQLRVLCDRERLWLHVDGAYGAASVISEEGRALLHGLELADSLSLDPHKWLYQPFGAGCVLVRRGEQLKATFRLLPDYLQDVHRHSEEINYTDMGIELSRGFRALKLWMSIKVFGLAAFRTSIGRAFHLAELAERTLRGIPDWEISSPAQMAVVCFRYRPGDDSLHARLVEAMLQDGHALCTSTTLRGRTVLRMCTINPLTTEEDIVTTVEHVNALALRVQDSL